MLELAQHAPTTAAAQTAAIPLVMYMIVLGGHGVARRIRSWCQSPRGRQAGSGPTAGPAGR